MEQGTSRARGKPALLLMAVVRSGSAGADACCEVAPHRHALTRATNASAPIRHRRAISFQRPCRTDWRCPLPVTVDGAVAAIVRVH
jgi:hypothetical protein